MLNKVSTILTISVLFVGTLLAGCMNNKEATTNVKLAMSSNKFLIELDQDMLPIERWKKDTSHLVEVRGKLWGGGKPVAGVELGAPGKRNLTTDDNGVFKLLVDRSFPQSIHLQVNSAAHATIEGKALDHSSMETLKSTGKQILVYHPIQVMKVKVDPTDTNKVEVHARAVTEDGQSYPLTILDKYVIQGVVKDAKGIPIKGAVVNFNRGEGWSRSAPANDKGEYILYYFPEPNEDLLLSVLVEGVKYTLPENRVNRFPEGTSVHTDIILPATGTIIEDKPPSLVSNAAKGALYWSQAIGVSVPPSIAYSISLPTKDGSFVLRIDKTVWETSPPFFQTVLRKFSETPIKAGAFIPSVWIPAPKQGEPSGIIAESL